MTKAQTAEKDEAIARLREMIKPGDTVYTILDHVSASGMSRAIRVVVPYTRERCDVCGSDVTPARGERSRIGSQCARENDKGEYICSGQIGSAIDHLHPNYAVGKVLGLRHWKRNGHEQDALVVGGCGMDMGFHLVYELSHALYGRAYCPVCHTSTSTANAGDPCPRVKPAPCTGVLTGGFTCIGPGCPSNDHTNGDRAYTIGKPHSDGGYALQQRWL